MNAPTDSSSLPICRPGSLLDDEMKLRYLEEAQHVHGPERTRWLKSVGLTEQMLTLWSGHLQRIEDSAGRKMRSSPAESNQSHIPIIDTVQRETQDVLRSLHQDILPLPTSSEVRHSNGKGITNETVEFESAEEELQYLLATTHIPPVIRGQKREFSDEQRERVVRIGELLCDTGGKLSAFLEMHGVVPHFYNWRRQLRGSETAGQAEPLNKADDATHEGEPTLGPSQTPTDSDETSVNELNRLLETTHIPPTIPGQLREFSEQQRANIVRIGELILKTGGRLTPFLQRHNLAHNYYAWRHKLSTDAASSTDAAEVVDPMESRIERLPENTESEQPNVGHLAWVRTEVPVRHLHPDATTEGEERIERIRREVGLIVEGDERMEQIWEDIQRMARNESQILLRGPTGTGKELFFRAIHMLRAGTGAKHHEVNCAGLNEGVIESELFGHTKGAFTGAHENRKGAFDAVANGGTLLLDEIGDMPMTQQSKLLRVLESREFCPVGSTKVTRLEDVKIVAATNRPLEQLIKDGKFRQDLYHRLTENEVHLPPLHDRSIEHRDALIGAFLKQMSTADTEVCMTAEALALFRSGKYEGNVRDLRHHVRRARDHANTGIGSILIGLDSAEKTQRRKVDEREMILDELVSYFGGALRMKLAEDGNSLHATIHLTEIHQNATEVIEAIFTLLTQGMVAKTDNQSRTSDVLGISRGSIRTKLRNAQSLLIPDPPPE